MMLSATQRRATAFENRRQLAKIGQPVDRGEWAMTSADGRMPITTRA